MRTVTGWQLCAMVIDKLRREPERYNQLAWTTTQAERKDWSMPEAPRCGTSFCIGGWMQEMMGMESILDVPPALGLHWVHMSRELFQATAAGDYTCNPDDPKPGTREFADRGIAHLKKWMDANKAALKAAQVGVNTDV